MPTLSEVSAVSRASRRLFGSGADSPHLKAAVWPSTETVTALRRTPPGVDFPGKDDIDNATSPGELVRLNLGVLQKCITTTAEQLPPLVAPCETDLIDGIEVDAFLNVPAPKPIRLEGTVRSIRTATEELHLSVDELDALLIEDVDDGR